MTAGRAMIYVSFFFFTKAPEFPVAAKLSTQIPFPPMIMEAIALSK